ncbi:hypothetical protein ABB02_00865 [Clostridiaceae bacterium JG1575]|nr:hypothetical protein ABB02_00865 [Clostridiaceae bacterium JG1575]
MIERLLNKHTVRVQVSCATRDDLIHEGLRDLLAQGCVEERYEKAIQKAFEAHGNYMAIAPGFLLSHARPEDGVLALGMSCINLKEGVSIGSENDPIRLVITLAAKDNTSHITALQELMHLLMDEDVFEQLKTTDSLDTMLSLLKGEETK